MLSNTAFIIICFNREMREFSSPRDKYFIRWGANMTPTVIGAQLWWQGALAIRSGEKEVIDDSKPFDPPASELNLHFANQHPPPPVPPSFLIILYYPASNLGLLPRCFFPLFPPSKNNAGWDLIFPQEICMGAISWGKFHPLLLRAV